MIYDHSRDLPQDYDLLSAVDVFRQPDQLNLLHRQAEKANFLNSIGHSAIRAMFLRDDDLVVGLAVGGGAALYEIITMPRFTGAISDSVPAYFDTEGQNAAIDTVNVFSSCDLPTARRVAGHELARMKSEARAMYGLINWAIDDVFPGSSPKQRRRVKTGAALMRMLHADAYERLGGEKNKSD